MKSIKKWEKFHRRCIIVTKEANYSYDELREKILSSVRGTLNKYIGCRIDDYQTQNIAIELERIVRRIEETAPGTILDYSCHYSIDNPGQVAVNISINGDAITDNTYSINTGKEFI